MQPCNHATITGTTHSSPRSRSGYILLISILVIGVIAAEVVSSLLLLGTSSARSSFSLEQSSQALSIAHGCGEYALEKLRESIGYAGNEVLTLSGGTCDIQVGGVGATNRTVCIEANVNDVLRRMEIIVERIQPQVKIFSWREVALFSLCQ